MRGSRAQRKEASSNDGGGRDGGPRRGADAVGDCGGLGAVGAGGGRGSCGGSRGGGRSGCGEADGEVDLRHQGLEVAARATGEVLAVGVAGGDDRGLRRVGAVGSDSGVFKGDKLRGAARGPAKPVLRQRGHLVGMMGKGGLKGCGGLVSMIYHEHVACTRNRLQDREGCDSESSSVYPVGNCRRPSLEVKYVCSTGI